MSKARVLAIDDQPYFRRFVEDLLGEEGFAVRTAASGQEALELIEAEGPFELVVTDVILSDADGIEMIARLSESWPQQRVVVLSSISDVRAAVAAMRAGATDYLLKPIDRAGLPAALERALASPGAQEAPQADPELLAENLAYMTRLSLMQRAAELLLTPDRHSFERDLLTLLSAEARAADAILWVADERPDGFRLAVVSGELPDDGTAPQRPQLDEQVERDLRRGQVVQLAPRTGSERAELLVPVVLEDRLLAIARLLSPDGEGFPDAAPAACAQIAELVRAAIVRFEAPPAASPAPTEPCEAAAPAEPVEPLRDPCTGLPGRAFLEEVAEIEIHKAHRYGRRVSVICVELGDVPKALLERACPSVVATLRRTLRGTDVAASDGHRRFWVMISDADPLGGVVLKRRLGQRLRESLREAELEIPLALGAAAYPTNGERFDLLRDAALRQVHDERRSIAQDLDIDAETPLAGISERLLTRAVWVPPAFIGEAAQLLIGEVSCRPRDRGLLFLAPGEERKSVMDALTALGDAETATDVFVATDGETLPSGTAITALGLPPEVAPETTLILRFGEAPAYALVAGPSRDDGARPVFHCADPVLIEHMTFRLRAEIGFGVRA